MADTPEEREKQAIHLAAQLCDQLDPVLTHMVQRLGVELTCVVLRGLCDRIQARARRENLWSDTRYRAMVRIDEIAAQLASKAAQG